MRSPIARLYALSAALVVFFLSWALVAARPWASNGRAADPRLAALAAREHRLQAETLAVRRLLRRRWGSYRVTLVHRRRAIAAAQRRIAQLTAQAQAPAPSAYAAPAVVAPVFAPPVIRSAPITATRTS